ncbi:MAG: SpaA isopeptide-forming pilin-related protein [Atopobiaceae bacterium]|nr:SpaA isopeptide-forming pilin-related protein [Atopobiaceae bacterium]
MRNQRTSGPLDIYVTFTALYTGSIASDGKVYWGPYLRDGSVMSDGFWVENSVLYKTSYRFVDSETGEDVSPEGGFSYTERSMNIGEGFMVDGATIGYVSDDLPDSILGTNDLGITWAKNDANPALAHTQVTGLESVSDPVWQGYVGSVPQTVRHGVTASTNPPSNSNHDLFLNQYFDSPARFSGNQYVQGADSMGVVQATITVDGVTATYPDASMWMGASVIVPSSSQIDVIGVNFPRDAIGGRSSRVTFGDFSLSTEFFSQGQSFEEAYQSVTGHGSALDTNHGVEFMLLGSHRWYVPQFHVFTAVTPPEPEKEVNREVCSLGDTISYTVRQQINNAGINAWPGYRYGSMEFSDTLPIGLTYTKDSFKVYNGTGEPVDSGRLEVSGDAATGMILHWKANEDWLASGLAMDGGDLTFVFDTTAAVAPTSGEYANSAHVLINEADLVTNEVVTVLQGEEGTIQLKKSSALPDIDANNPCYSLEGASYGVYTTPECSDADLVCILTTRADGTSDAIELEPGTYWVKETDAPLGYALDATVYEASVNDGETAIINACDVPQSSTVEVAVRKVDSDLGEATPQGAASLAGAEFEIRFYAGYFESGSLPETAQRCWTIRTDDAGEARLDQQSLVAGDDLFLDGEGRTILPLGTLVIRETAAPVGYVLPEGEAVVVRQITPQGTGPMLETFAAEVVDEQIVLGGIKVKKVNAHTGTGLAGAKFSIKNETGGSIVVQGNTYQNGQECLVIESGADGIAQTPLALPYGSYSITEKEAPNGYQRDEQWSQTATITEHNAVVDLTGLPVRNAPAARIPLPLTGQLGTREVAAGGIVTLIAAMVRLMYQAYEGGIGR